MGSLLEKTPSQMASDLQDFGFLYYGLASLPHGAFVWSFCFLLLYPVSYSFFLLFTLLFGYENPFLVLI